MAAGVSSLLSEEEDPKEHKEPEELEELETPQNDQIAGELVEKQRRRDTVLEWLPGTFRTKKKGLRTKNNRDVTAGNTSTFKSGNERTVTIKRSTSEKLSSMTEKGMEKAKDIGTRLTTKKKYKDPLDQWMYKNSGGTFKEKPRPSLS